jgi:hypothetical protein
MNRREFVKSGLVVSLPAFFGICPFLDKDTDKLKVDGCLINDLWCNYSETFRWDAGEGLGVYHNPLVAEKSNLSRWNLLPVFRIDKDAKAISKRKEHEIKPAKLSNKVVELHIEKYVKKDYVDFALRIKKKSYMNVIRFYDNPYEMSIIFSAEKMVVIPMDHSKVYDETEDITRSINRMMSRF